jgi:uncharacterized membrane protein YqjE
MLVIMITIGFLAIPQSATLLLTGNTLLLQALMVPTTRLNKMLISLFQLLMLGSPHLKTTISSQITSDRMMFTSELMTIFGLKKATTRVTASFLSWE